MSAVSELVTLLESKIEELLPSYKPMPFMYLPELNERLQVKNYAIRVGSASTTEGTNRAVTFDHSISIDLSQRFEPKKSQGDKDLRDKISVISNDIQTLYKELYRRPGALASATLMVIAPLDLSEPTVDNENNLVSLTLTLSVKYRVLN